MCVIFKYEFSEVSLVYLPIMNKAWAYPSISLAHHLFICVK